MENIKIADFLNTRPDTPRRVKIGLLVVLGLYMCVRAARNENSLFYMGGGGDGSTSMIDIMLGVCFYLLHQA